MNVFVDEASTGRERLRETDRGSSNDPSARARRSFDNEMEKKKKEKKETIERSLVAEKVA